MFKFTHKHLRLVAVAGLAALGGVAVAQSIALSKVDHTGPATLVQVIKGGQPQALSTYATVPQVSGVQGYSCLNACADAAGDALTYTATAGVSNIFAFSGGSAITSATITTEASPGDGQRECYVGVGAATTTLTFTANTGQTVVPSITAGVSNVPICITYVAPNASWYRSN